MELIKDIKESEIQTVDHPVDETGRMIYEDGIEFKCRHEELLFLHKTVRDMLDANLVPMPEIDPCIKLLEMLAERERTSYEEGFIFLPVNYFAGLWHCLNTARSFDIYNKSNKLANQLDQTTMYLATQLDEYHKLKNPEANKAITKKESLESFRKVVEDMKQITNNKPQT